MPLRHTVYCLRSVAKVTPEGLLKRLKAPDYWTLAEDYGISEEDVEAARPLELTSAQAGLFVRYQLSYGKAGKRPIDVERWETAAQHRSAADETIDNLAVADKARAKKIAGLLRRSVDSVSVTFGIDPPAAMFAWEAVRYFAAEFDGIIHADDGEWLKIGRDYLPTPV